MYKNFTKRICKAFYVPLHSHFLKMKLTVTLLLLSMLQAVAATYGQNVTINVDKASFEKVTQIIAKQTGYHFLYNKQYMNNSVPVTLHVQDQPIKNVLTKFFAEQPFEYIINETNVIITGLKKSPAKTQGVPVTDVSGVIKDEKGQPLPGVSVGIKGTTKGTTTDMNGRYSFTNLDDKSVLVFSFIGYVTQEIAVNGRQTIDILLSVSDNSLSDVVVVGYTTQKRATLTGSVATVKSEDITVAPTTSTINTLAGRLPGLVSQQSSGRPGVDQASISIRGFGQAIWIVDGVESDFNNIDPNQIESISILKDGAAAKKMGSTNTAKCFFAWRK
ncbi:MAG: hypothetical protein EOP45_05510 [Sphingobacteriaceae bacterium]|nr:MAG: hypothetical protein EOP45_05510 [Sphingobacteriaceae bacterium]